MYIKVFKLQHLDFLFNNRNIPLSYTPLPCNPLLIEVLLAIANRDEIRESTLEQGHNIVAVSQLLSFAVTFRNFFYFPYLLAISANFPNFYNFMQF